MMSHSGSNSGDRCPTTRTSPWSFTSSSRFRSISLFLCLVLATASSSVSAADQDFFELQFRRQVTEQQSNKADPGSCDGSKCRGLRPHPWVDGDSEYTCWIPVGDAEDVLSRNRTEEASYVHDLCSDGYVGRILSGSDGAFKIEDGVTYEWFTCCPPEYDGVVSQHCDDRACSSPDWTGGGNCWADGFQEPMTCSSPEFRYPKTTGLMSLIYAQYVCCDTPSESDFARELFLARVIWVSLSAITFVVCTIFIAAILSSKRARKDGFNMYLVYLAIPDGLANLILLIRNYLTMTGAPVNPTVHIILASIEYFYAAANMWLNAVIVHRIYGILLNSNKRIRAPLPTPEEATKRAGYVYLFSSIWGAWAFYLYHRGLVAFSLSAVVNVWIITRVCLVTPPLFYVMYVCFQVFYHQLLPISGRTRVLSLYFLRVVFVFLITWVPYFIIYELAWNITYSRWMVNSSYYLGSVQGTLSVMVALSKPDVKRAVVNFLYGRCYQTDEEIKKGLVTGSIYVPTSQEVKDTKKVVRRGETGETMSSDENSDEGPPPPPQEQRLLTSAAVARSAREKRLEEVMRKVKGPDWVPESKEERAARAARAAAATPTPTTRPSNIKNNKKSKSTKTELFSAEDEWEMDDVWRDFEEDTTSWGHHNPKEDAMDAYTHQKPASTKAILEQVEEGNGGGCDEEDIPAAPPTMDVTSSGNEVDKNRADSPRVTTLDILGNIRKDVP